MSVESGKCNARSHQNEDEDHQKLICCYHDVTRLDDRHLLESIVEIEVFESSSLLLEALKPNRGV